MAVITATVDVEAKCSECGSSLEATYWPNTETLDVEPCARCLDEAEGRGEDRAARR